MPHAHRPILFATACLGLLVAGLCFANGTEVPLAPAACSVPVTAMLQTMTANHEDGACRAAVARRCYDVRVGERLELACRMDVTACLTTGNGAGGAAQRLATSLEGRLELVAVARRDAELALAIRMRDVTVRGGEPADAARLSASLASATVVHLSPRGTILGYRFPELMAAAHRNQVRSLFAAVRSTVGAADEQEWVAVEADATGQGEVAGAWAAGGQELTIHKRAYRPRTGALIPQVDGRGAAVLDPVSGWWRRVHYTEASSLLVADTDLAVSATATVQAELRHQDNILQSTLAPFDWTAPWSPASGADERNDAAMDPEATALAAELRGVTFGAEFARLRDLQASAATDIDLYAARRRLVWLLRHDPIAIAELQGLLADATLSPQLVGEVLSAVGGADTEACHAVLANLLAGGPTTTTRVSAAQAMFQSSAPATAALPAIRAALADSGAAVELHGTGLLLLGALATRADGDGPLRELLGREAFARDRGLVVDWLEALGNAGRPEVAEVALAHFDAMGAEERTAAIAAVRKVDQPRVLQALVDRAEHDEVPMVRSRAIESLAGRRNADVVPLLERILGTDQDEAVRTSALLALAIRADPANRTRILELVAGQDPAASLRTMARDMLSQSN